LFAFIFLSLIVFYRDAIFAKDGISYCSTAFVVY